MFPPKTLLSLTFSIALSAVDASSLSPRTGKATLGFTTKINERGVFAVADKDRARAQTMQSTGKIGRRSGSISVMNDQVLYTTQVGVGTPSTEYTLVIDTGSSNTFVGLNKTYTPTSSSHDTGNTVSVDYGSGSWSGHEWIDTLTLGPGLMIDQQSIGVANTSNNLSGFDGILGVGPVDLSQGRVSNTTTVPTVMDNLFSQGTISEEVLGIHFVPSGESVSTGKLTFGGYDQSEITDSVDYVPLTTISPASKYWGIEQSIEYGGNTILSSTAGIVDTGTTLILIATDAFQRYQNATGAVMDSATGFFRITLDQYSSLQSLFFNIENKSYELTRNGQIWPRSLNSAIGGSSGSIYLIVGDLQTSSGAGFDFILGYSFLQRFYSVYDTTNGRVGFACTSHTNSTSN